jgi:hypothetical protein
MAYDVDEMDIYIAEKDAEIAELKKKLMPCLNGDCILTCEVVEKYGKENAELKAENERLRDESCKLTDGCLRLKQCRKEKANIADELRHQKRERCLAMAMWCFEKSYSTTLVKYDEKSGLLRNFYDWWGKRWLKLAEKFKPNKSTAQ